MKNTIFHAKYTVGYVSYLSDNVIYGYILRHDTLATAKPLVWTTIETHQIMTTLHAECIDFNLRPKRMC